MCLGIGIGLMVEFFVRVFVEWVVEGFEVVGVLMLEWIVELVFSLGILFVILEDLLELDFMVDGVDELDVNFVLIKGGGGVLLCEKIVVVVFM